MKLNKSQLAEALGVSTQSVDGWVRRGCPVEQRGRNGVPWVFVLADVVEWLTERDSADGGGNADLSHERALLAREQRRKTSLEVRKLEGSLVPAELVSAGWSAMVGNARARLLSLPTKTAPLVQACISLPEIERVIKDQVHEALTELAGDGMPPEVREQARAYIVDIAESA